MTNEAIHLLESLDQEYVSLHAAHEYAFWCEHMGIEHTDMSVTDALSRLDAFRGNTNSAHAVDNALADENLSDRERKALLQWKRYFSCYSFSAESLRIKEKISAIESRVNTEQSSYAGGYIDPDTREVIQASVNTLSLLVKTSPDERVRKAAFDAIETYSIQWVEELTELVGLRNELARTMGYRDYYDMQARRYEGVSSEEIFAVFDRVRAPLASTYDDIRAIAADEPSVLKPWNLTARFSGASTRAADPYFPIEHSVSRWLRSMSGLGMDFSGGTVVLDLFDRTGKHRGGFCHWPTPVHYRDGKRVAGVAQFSCTAVANAAGSGADTFVTLFHEGGHALHFLASENPVAALNAEYAPTSIAWAETQSMWFDGLIDSLAWRVRYARTASGEAYPEELHKEILEAESPLRAYEMMRIVAIVELERRLYSAEALTVNEVFMIAKDVFRDTMPCDEDSLRLLATPHIYSSESSCYYHGYGLASMGLAMYNRLFLERYGARIDRPVIADDLRAAWRLGGAINFFEGIELVTGQKFSPDDYLDEVLADADTRFAREKAELAALDDTPIAKFPQDLGAHMKIAHGAEILADSTSGLDHLEESFRAWTMAWQLSAK